MLGYIGAEAATDIWFSSLLWPPRSFSYLTLQSIPALALLMPMGGPLHKAALSTFDIANARDLLKGAHEGHMLGTSFFKQTEWTFTIPGAADFEPRAARNCMWARALHYMPLPGELSGALVGLSPPATGDAIEKGILPSANNGRIHLRAKVAVYHLTLSRATASLANGVCAREPWPTRLVSLPQHLHRRTLRHHYICRHLRHRSITLVSHLAGPATPPPLERLLRPRLRASHPYILHLIAIYHADDRSRIKS